MTELKVTGRVLQVSEATRRRNPELYGDNREGTCVATVTLPEPSKPNPPRRIRQSQKPLMNKLESSFFEILKATHPGVTIRPQAKRFRLANGLWYKPDFTAPTQGRETAWEVKGPHAFRGGFENLKMAASAYPEIRWILAWKENGTWQRQEVLP